MPETGRAFTADQGRSQGRLRLVPSPFDKEPLSWLWPEGTLIVLP